MSIQYDGPDFFAALREKKLKRPHIVNGLIKLSEDGESLMFSSIPSGDWVELPFEMIDGVEWHGEVPGVDDTHQVSLQLKEPENVESRIYLKIIGSQIQGYQSSAMMIWSLASSGSITGAFSCPLSSGQGAGGMTTTASPTWRRRSTIQTMSWSWWPGHDADFHSAAPFPPNTEYCLRVTSKGNNCNVYLDNYLGNVGIPGTVNAIPFKMIPSPPVGQIYPGIIPTGIIFGLRVSGLNFSEQTQQIHGGVENDEYYYRFYFTNNWIIDIKFYGNPF